MEAHPEKLALWSEQNGAVSFREIGQYAAAKQKSALDFGLQCGDTALVMARPGVELYSTILALLGLGVCIVFVEPWIPAKQIDYVLKLVDIKLVFLDGFGWLWRLGSPRLQALKAVSISDEVVGRLDLSAFQVNTVSSDLPATVSFTSGTTGTPKGVVRTHAYLWELHEILAKYGQDEKLEGPDLAVFPNLALYHLGTGRSSLLVPPSWSVDVLNHIQSFDQSLWPQSVSCGPAFLRHLLNTNRAFSSLTRVHVGGALVECDLLQRARKVLPDADIRQIYGGTEVEPLAFIDAHISLENARRKGFFHALSVGHPISELRMRLSLDSVLWVSGPNVCPEYLGHARAFLYRDEARIPHLIADDDIQLLKGACSVAGL